MGSTDDPGDYKRRYQRQKELIHDLDDHDRSADATAIRKWTNGLTQAYSTRTTHLKNVRTFAKRAALTDRPALTEMTEGDYYELHDALETGDDAIAAADAHFPADGLGYGTLRGIRQALKHFFADALGREWADDITVGTPKQTHVTENDVFDGDDTGAIFDACIDTQEQALVATLLATGLRIGAVHSLRLGDVAFRPVGEATLAFITIRTEVIGTKGLAGERPLTWASPYVKNWVGAHPRQGDDDAPLFCAKQSGENPSGSFTRGDHVERRTLHRWLEGIKKRTEVDTPLNPHTFRHTAITRMYYDDVPEKRIKWMVGWGKDSSQFERYVHLRDEEMMAGFLADYGHEDAVPDVGPAFDTCPHCSAPLHEWVNPQACPGCGLPLNVTAADLAASATALETDAKDTALAESLSDAERAGLQAMLDDVEDDATRAVLAGVLGDADLAE